MSKPQAYLLCGLTGSGKTTYAEKLVAQGFVKLSIDEAVHDKYGRAGIDYPAEKYPAYEALISKELQEKLVELLHQGKSVVLDYGFWKRANRDFYKRLMEQNGGTWHLIYFKASPALLRQRLKQRNNRTDANAFTITESMLNDFIERFEEPHGEGEEIVEVG